MVGASGVNGLRMLGVLHHTVVFLLEQLYGAKYCRNYRFRFHKPEVSDEPPINPHGSARVELHHRYRIVMRESHLYPQIGGAEL